MELGSCVTSITFQAVYLAGRIYGARQSSSYSVMKLESHRARSVCYFYYILGSLPSRTYLWSQEFSHGARKTQSQVCLLLLLHSRQSTQPNESIELGIHGARSVCYFYYILGSLPSRTNLWSQAVMELFNHGARESCCQVRVQTAQNVIEVVHRLSSMAVQLHDCLAPQILPARQTAQNVIKVTRGPSSMKSQLHRFVLLGRLPRM